MLRETRCHRRCFFNWLLLHILLSLIVNSPYTFPIRAFHQIIYTEMNKKSSKCTLSPSLNGSSFPELWLKTLVLILIFRPVFFQTDSVWSVSPLHGSTHLLDKSTKSSTPEVLSFFLARSGNPLKHDTRRTVFSSPQSEVKMNSNITIKRVRDTRIA